MNHMNDFDLDYARQRFTLATKPNRLGMVMVVDQLRVWADENSDGWHAWPKPCRAAAGAIALIQSSTWEENRAQEEVDATDAEVTAAMRPIKAFLTRQKVREDRREVILRGGEPLP